MDPSTLQRHFPTFVAWYCRLLPLITAMGRIAVTLGLKRVAVLNEMGDDGNLMVGLFGAAFGIEGGRVVSEGDLEPGTTDFTGFLNAARAAGAQAGPRADAAA